MHVCTYARMHVCMYACNNKNNNNKEFLCANILESRAQWRDKTKELSNLVIVNNARVVTEWMKVDNVKGIRLQTPAELIFFSNLTLAGSECHSVSACVSACVRGCVRACVRASVRGCVCVCGVNIQCVPIHIC